VGHFSIQQFADGMEQTISDPRMFDRIHHHSLDAFEEQGYCLTKDFLCSVLHFCIGSTTEKKEMSHIN